MKGLSFCVQHLVSGPRSLRLPCVCEVSQCARPERSITKQQLTEGGAPKTNLGQNNNAKSYKCPGKPGAQETNAKKGEGLPRPPLKTFSLREGRGDEGAILGLS